MLNLSVLHNLNNLRRRKMLQILKLLKSTGYVMHQQV